MLAGMRSRFLLSVLLTFALAGSLPVRAQVNGVPPSVTSIGFGGRFINGVPPSVTSLGPNGYGSLPFLDSCCANFLLPATPNPSLFSSHRHRRKKDKDKDKNLVGVIEPVYVPYGVPDADEADDDPPPDIAYAPGAGPLSADFLGKRAVSHDSIANNNPVSEAEVPVTAQPSTVLVFKDGHRSDVLNYAVVGDTLFVFATDRTRKIPLADLDLPATRKANDDRGVDFQIPAGASR